MRGKVIGITRGSLGLSGGINLGIAGESVRAFLDGAQLVPADNAEPDSAREQASALVVGAGPQFHSLHIAGDVDWFSLSLAEGGAVAVFTDSDRCDTVLELYAPDGVTLLDEDDDGGRNLSSWIGLTAPETGVYYGRVSHASPSGVCQSYYLAARAL